MGVAASKSTVISDKTVFTPSIQADYAYIKEEDYTETGADALNLSVDSHTHDELVLKAQAELSHEINGQARFTTHIGVGYDLLNEETYITAAYSGGGSSFTTQTIDPAPWLVDAGVGINYSVDESTEISARYDLEGRSDFLDHSASVNLRWKF
jgi:outer membrane autotransporter protein